MIGASMDIELARQQWNEGRRRVEARRGRSPPRTSTGCADRDRDRGALRHRSGSTFTLEELADVYDGADDWARARSTTQLPDDAPPPETSTVAGAAFYRYAAARSDYAP